MSTIRLKYRPSSVAGKEGTLFFQIIHKRQVRQLYTGLYILPQEWNEAAGCVCIPARADADRARYLTALKRSLDEIRDKLSLAVAQLEGAGSPYTARDVVAAFRGPTKEAFRILTKVHSGPSSTAQAMCSTSPWDPRLCTHRPAPM